MPKGHYTRGQPIAFATDGERKAYARGATNRNWPAHKPPLPPEGMVAEMMKAGQALRDASDTLCASISANDEWALKLDPLIDAWDWQMKALTEWLKSSE